MTRDARKRHLAGLLTGIAVLLLSIWPLYPWIGGLSPTVMGMPFSMVWLCLMIAVVFLTFLSIFMADRSDDEALDREYRSDS